MPRLSAGLLLYRRATEGLEVFLVHPGGPYWAAKDLGVWSIPKGEYVQGEDPLAAAVREFHEETGFSVAGPFLALEPVKQPGGKIVTAWAIEGDCDASAISSNTFTMEWPPRSRTFQKFPEVDRAAWFSIAEARTKILKGQLPLIEELVDLVEDHDPGSAESRLR